MAQVFSLGALWSVTRLWGQFVENWMLYRTWLHTLRGKTRRSFEAKLETAGDISEMFRKLAM